MRGHFYRPRIEALEDRALLSTDTWTGGGGVNAGWSDPANWNTGRTPAPGDDLIFPPVTSVIPTNDLAPGTVFHSLSCTGSVTIQGNAIVLTGSLGNNSQQAAAIRLNGITLGTDVAFIGNCLVYSPIECNGFTLSLNTFTTCQQPPTILNGAIYGSINLGGTLMGTWQVLGAINVTTPNSTINCNPQGPINLNSFTLTITNTTYQGVITGSGGIIVAGTVGLSGAQNYTGTTAIPPGAQLQVGAGDFPGPIVVQGTLFAFNNFQTPTTILTTGPLRFTSGSVFELHGNPGGKPLVQVNGAVDLGGANLQAMVSSFSPPAAVIMIESTGGLAGTFNGLPDGVSITLGGQSCQIHYYNGSVCSRRGGRHDRLPLHANLCVILGIAGRFVDSAHHLGLRGQHWRNHRQRGASARKWDRRFHGRLDSPERSDPARQRLGEYYPTSHCRHTFRHGRLHTCGHDLLSEHVRAL